MIGVAYGAPTEFRSKAKINEGELKWTPEMVENALHQDDLYVDDVFESDGHDWAGGNQRGLWDDVQRFSVTTRAGMVSASGGDEATLEFDGVAVALVGPLNQEGGRAEVYVDGKKAGVADAYMVQGTHDNALWHTYGLRPGGHTVRLVTLGQSDARSKGTRVGLQEAVVYRRR